MQALVKFATIVLGILILNACNSLKHSVLFGDRTIPDAEATVVERFENGKTIRKADIHVFRLYFDREGILYPPDCSVPEAFLKANNYTFILNNSTFSTRPETQNQLVILEKSSKFRTYSALYRTQLDSLGYKYRLSKLKDQERVIAFKEAFEAIALNDYMKRINDTIDSGGYTNVSFVMVGFNNKLMNPVNSFNSSETKLRLLRQEIQSILDNYNLRRDTKKFPDPVKTLFIEVHWDGKFTSKKGIRTGFNYRPALRTSYKVGLTLRKIINELDPKVKVQLLSHSSGANIICESLFNQISKVKKKGREHELWAYLDYRYTNPGVYLTPNPDRTIVAGLLAPSIPGKETFADYYERSQPFKVDSYQMVIGYNLDDPDLRKKFGNFWIGGILSIINSKDYLVKQNVFGSTALGCLKYEVDAVKNLFRKSYALENIQFIDFTYTEINGNKLSNTVHPVEQYIKIPQYRQFIEAVYQLNPSI